MKFSLDPRAKLALILLANAMLFFHVSRNVEIIMVLLFIFPLLACGKTKTGLRFLILYGLMIAADLWLIPVAEGFLLNFLSLVSVGIRMILPCIITGAYAFTTTTVGEFVCALRKMHVSESVIIPCMVVIRFFPTIREDYRQIRASMALRGICEGGLGLLAHPMQTLEYIMIPLLMNGNNVAQDLSVAALTKGIGIQSEHTCMTELSFTIMDLSYVLIACLPVLLFVGGVL